MKRIGVLLLAGLLLLTGCAAEKQIMDGPDMFLSYQQIDMETAKQMMGQDDGHVIVDVRRFDEYERGHIPGAVCIPNESIGDEQPEELPNLSQIILIYCRSGNRSKQAAEKLFNMGYSNIYEFGGIIDWTDGIAVGQTLALTVESNPTTGFAWELVQDQELFDIQTGYIAQPQLKPVSGSGGWQTFILTPKQAGTVQVTFTYTRSWEPSDADPQFSCTVDISEDFMITVTEDGSGQAADYGYATAMKIY